MSLADHQAVVRLMTTPGRSWVLWGSELSPFALEVEALLRFSEVPFRCLPASGPFTDAPDYLALEVGLIPLGAYVLREGGER